MIVSGEPIGAADAKAIGLVDEVVEGGDLVEAAVAFAQRVAPKRPLPRARDLTAPLEQAKKDPSIFEKAKKDAAARARVAKPRSVASKPSRLPWSLRSRRV